MNDIKSQLYNFCMEYAEERISTANEAIKAARDSSNDDTKSSAGDKYETGRAMMQQDIDRQTLQLGEAQNLKALLERIEPQRVTETVQNGSLVFTNQGIFYIAISAGLMELKQKSYYVISAASPIGLVLLKKAAGEKFTFNNKNYVIEAVH